MSSLSTLEAYDLVRFAEALEARLVSASDLLAEREALETEKEWMATALRLVRTGLAPATALIERAKDLPELEEAREEFSFQQQNAWVDALEKLHAGITFCASSRAPVIEALFPHLKFPQLRRAPQDAVTEFATAYERRLKSSYVTRIFAQDDFAFVRPVVDQVARTYAAWQASLTPAPLAEAQAAPLRAELVVLGLRLDLCVRQARLLAEAALVPVPGVFDSSGLAAKPKKRAGRGGAFGFEEAAPEEVVPEPPVEPVAPRTEPAPAPEETAVPPTTAEPAGVAPAEPKPSRRGRKKAGVKPPELEAQGEHEGHDTLTPTLSQEERGQDTALPKSHS